ncbi:MAG: TIGR02186 family protein [Oceanicaulis sp.]|nr:TIGR02186 family protein [Oceanicaulis sp.]
MMRAAVLTLALIAAALTAGPSHALQDAEPAAPAPEAQIAAALTEDVVEIRSNFAGAELVLYGAAVGLEPGDDIAVVVRGPVRDIRVMRRQRVLGVWVNADPVRFEEVAGYYAVASTRPLAEFATFSALRRNRIGMEHVRLSSPETERIETRFGVAGVVVSDIGAAIVDYRSAVVRNKARDALYVEAPGGVEVLEGGLFRARVVLPPATPTGIYDADVYLFREGVPIAVRRTSLEVVKAGAERVIYDIAHERPLAYGLLAVLLAVIAGWLASVVMRRN